MANPPSTLYAPQAGLFGLTGWCGLVLFPAILWVLLARGNVFTLYQVQSQDLAILLVLPLLLLLADRRTPAWQLPKTPPSAALIAIGGVALALMLGWGCHALMGNFPLSRDEQMVVFDMAVYEKWRLAAPVAAQWRPYAEALVPAFLLNDQNPAGLVSDYLPINAMLRLGFSRVLDPALYNPLLMTFGGLALFDIARRLFRESTQAQWVAILVYVLSTQALVNSMTTYAMTGHMALNLIWLAAFLRGGKTGHAIAISVAFLATGLHQIVFHPMFAAPFILWRAFCGDWRLATLYSAAYVGICAFWVAFPMIASDAVLSHGAVRATNSDVFPDKLLPLLLHRDPATLPLMILNMLRFFAWQNLALLPLLVGAALALPQALRERSVLLPLLGGIIIIVPFLAFILPFQGHGWGYRYLHPFLGSFALLAGFGYQHLAARFGSKVDGMILLLSSATLALAIPLLAWRISDFVAPHVALEHILARQQADFVLIDTEDEPSTDGRWAANAIDHVRNQPDLSNRPLRFSSRHMNSGMLIALCSRGSMAAVTRAQMRHVGFGLNMSARSARFEALLDILKRRGCLK